MYVMTTNQLIHVRENQTNSSAGLPQVAVISPYADINGWIDAALQEDFALFYAASLEQAELADHPSLIDCLIYDARYPAFELDQPPQTLDDVPGAIQQHTPADIPVVLLTDALSVRETVEVCQTGIADVVIPQESDPADLKQRVTAAITSARMNAVRESAVVRNELINLELMRKERLVRQTIDEISNDLKSQLNQALEAVTQVMDSNVAEAHAKQLAQVRGACWQAERQIDRLWNIPAQVVSMDSDAGINMSDLLELAFDELNPMAEAQQTALTITYDDTLPELSQCLHLVSTIPTMGKLLLERMSADTRLVISAGAGEHGEVKLSFDLTCDFLPPHPAASQLRSLDLHALEQDLSNAGVHPSTDPWCRAAELRMDPQAPHIWLTLWLVDQAHDVARPAQEHRAG